MQRFRRSAPLLALPLAAILAGCGARRHALEHVGGDVSCDRPPRTRPMRLQVVSDGSSASRRSDGTFSDRRA